MSALLTSQTGNTTQVVKYINECREMGITVLPPDVNSSDWSFTPVGDAIRFGLGAVKNLGPSAVELMDDLLLRLSAGNLALRDTMKTITGNPQARASATVRPKFSFAVGRTKSSQAW
jgi:hypothetical protein